MRTFDIKKLMYNLYTLLILFSIFNMLTGNFGIKWSEIFSVLELVSLVSVIFFGILYISTNILLFNMLSGVKSLIEKNITANYIQVLEFWEKTNEYSKNKIIFFGISLAITVFLNKFNMV